MGNGNPYGHEASIYFILLIVGILSFSYNEPANSRVWHGVQFGLIFAITLGWGYVTMILNQPTNAQKQQEQENLQKAIPLAGDSGVTQQWYNQMGDILSKISVAAVTWIISAVVHSMIYSYPDSVFEHFGTMIQAKWENDILQNYSHKTIFIAGVWLSDFIVFWAFGLAYAFLGML